jgi:hypothetical protein
LDWAWAMAKTGVFRIAEGPLIARPRARRKPPQKKKDRARGPVTSHSDHP